MHFSFVTYNVSTMQLSIVSNKRKISALVKNNPLKRQKNSLQEWCKLTVQLEFNEA